MNEPVYKKRRLSSASLSDSSDEPMPTHNDLRARQLLMEEFELEIALRQRLAATIESRVTWALILQEALSNDITSESAPGSFEDAAVEAIEAIETPCNILFDNDPTLSQTIHELLERGSRTSVASESGPQSKSRARKSRIPRTHPQQPGTKLLFIRDTAVSPPTVAKMVCPDCGKSDFTNLQGLLNHARLRHRIEYGSHDQCMQSCAVIVDDADGQAEWVVKNGIELGGVSVPSVRRLFDIAVGDDRGMVDGFRAGAEENDEDADVISSTHLSKTLGHHKDTPALAPFLGRALKRRCINVYNEDEEVDVDGSAPTDKASWHMYFPHRNKARPELDMAVDTCYIMEPHTEAGSSVQFADVPHNASGTRFHIIARVVISDRSLWIPPERRAQALADHTHRWIVGVHSPSYSLHISAFLTRLTVTCITDPPPSTLNTPLTVAEPPFVISSTTDKPFLAKITLTWVGFQNAPMEVEHWVDLDPFHTSVVNPVLGDEQVLDVELDRYTELLPIRRPNDPSHRKRKGEEPTDSTENGAIASQSESDDQYYVAKLKALLPRFPMTMKDIKGRTSVQHIQYKLVATPAQLCGLVPGRRKAIEWGRALALRDAYEAVRTSSLPEDEEYAIPLTTSDVFRWLEDEGHFPRPAVDTIAKVPAQGTQKTKTSSVPTGPPTCFCSICGLKHQPALPASAMKAGSTDLIDGPHTACNIVHDMTNWHRMSMVDIRNPLGLSSNSANYHSSHPHLIFPTMTPSMSPPLFPSHDLVAVANPKITMAIREIVQPLGLSCFAHISEGTTSQVEAQVAPFALLASLTQSFIRLLVRSGLDAASLDMSMAIAEAKTQGRNSRKPKQPRDHLLTPSHIIRGLTGASIQRGQPLAATSLCLSRLGMGVSTPQPITMATQE